MKSQAIFDTRAIATRLFVLALLFATPRIPASAQELIFDTFMNDASAALKQNKLDEAQRLFASAMNEPYAKEHPGGVLCATYGLAIVKQRNKQYAEAERLLLQAMELLPKDSTAPATRSLLQFTLGKMYAKEGKLETADASLRSALDLSDSANEHFIATPAILTELASIYDREGKKSEARALREKAIELKKVAGTQPIPDTEQTNAQNGAAPSASQAKTDTPVAKASHGTGDSKLTDLEQLDALKAMYEREGKSTFAKDPDGGDAELAAEWLKWRDKVLGVVQSNVQAMLNNPTNLQLRFDPQKNIMVNRIPSGNAVYFSCQFTEDRHITNVKVLHTSGFPNFDSAVQDVITRLDGNSILAFPARSKRHVMPQIFGIRTADHPGPISTP